MRILRALLLACSTLILAGCIQNSLRTAMSADPLKPVTACPKVSDDSTAKTVIATNCTQGDTDLDRAHDLVQDSQDKCAKFVVAMFADNAKTNTILDIATTSFTALGTAFKSLSTVHALTAAGSISSGAKTSIDNNYLNALTISHIVQAVQTSYSIKMSEYITFLDAQTYINVYEARSSIQSIHTLCSLPQAEGVIQASLAPPSSSAPTSGQLSFTYTVKASDGAGANGLTAVELIAKNFATALTANSNFTSKGVSAAVSATSKSIIVISTDATKLSAITWKTPVVAAGKNAAGVQNQKPLITADFSGDTRMLIIGGSFQENDVITIKSDTLTPAKVSSASANTPDATATKKSATPPAAAIAGKATEKQ